MGGETGHDAQALTFARWLFAQPCAFVTAAAGLDSVPSANLPEIAFVGRSNVGKSSLINALTGRRVLARTSRTPGRTRQLNFFSLADRLMLVDLPGYGFARAPKSEVEAWTALTRAYLRGRATLRRCCLLIDARHGATPRDETMMALLDECAVSYQMILTKSDKATSAALVQQMAASEAQARRRPAAMPDLIATSAETGAGIDSLRIGLAALAVPEAMR